MKIIYAKRVDEDGGGCWVVTKDQLDDYEEGWYLGREDFICLFGENFYPKENLAVSVIRLSVI